MPMWSPGTTPGTQLGWVKNPRLRGQGHEGPPWRNRQCHLWVTPPQILKYQPHSDRKEIGIPYLSTEPWSFIPRARPRLSAKIIFYTGPEASLFWKHSRCSFKKGLILPSREAAAGVLTVFRLWVWKRFTKSICKCLHCIYRLLQQC